MKITKLLFILGLIIICLLTLIITISAKTNSGVDFQNSTSKKHSLSQEEYEKILEEKSKYVNSSTEISSEKYDFKDDLNFQKEIEKEEKYTKIQAENDKKAIDYLSQYFKKDFTQIAETKDIIQDDNSVITVTTREQIELYKNMLSALKSEKLDYSKVKPMILYLAHRIDRINDAFVNDSSFILDFEKVVAKYIKLDSELGHDIEVAYDPMIFGD